LRNDTIIIIPARSGSQGVKDKNIRVIGDKTLIQWTIETALNHVPPKNIILSTDSLAYAEIAKAFKITCENVRPCSLSTANALILDVVEFELHKFLAEKSDIESFKFCVLLEPSHFGRRENLAEALLFLDDNLSYNSCIGCYPVPTKYNWEKQHFFEKNSFKRVKNNPNYNRQDLEKSYIRSGEFYLFRLDEFHKQKSMFPEPSFALKTSEHSVNIDSLEDLKKAQYIFNQIKK
jgi:CMP-N-acetylneuraminic acid synthetase